MLDAPTATAVPAARTVELSISGMTCTACAARVEKKLTRIGPGVVAAVNFATEQATVTAPEDVPVRAMIAAVQDAGYAAGLIEPAAAPGARRRPGRLPAPPADPGAGVLRPAQRPVRHAVAVPRLPVHRMAMGPDRADRAGGAVGRLAVPPRRAQERPARRVLDGHAGVPRRGRRLRLVGVRDVPPGRRARKCRRERPAGTGASRGRRHLPRGGGRGHHVPAGRPVLRGPGAQFGGRRDAQARRGGRQGRLRARPRRPGAAHPGRPATARGHLRGPPGGEDRGRRRGAVRRVRGGPEHDDRRARPGRDRGRRRRSPAAPSRCPGGWWSGPSRSASTPSWPS